ncbi:MAG: AAA family ATPase [Bacteroides sp.]|nr:AAA family ATPase [Bacteroides sp.]
MKKENKEIKYPVGLQSFSEIIEGGYVYVDKTKFIHSLSKGKYYFLSRPRRFGKSLFISTVEAYYKGRRELFKGLEIENLTDYWEEHPIFHLDLSNRNYKDENSLIKELNANLEIWEEKYGKEKCDRDPEERFAYLIRKAFEKTGKKVVILVDEYDKPLLSTIDRPELAESYRHILKAFYSNLKSLDSYIQLAILTGVARFSKVSIFSDLNNLRDISFEDSYSEICGVTSDELQKYFQEGISEIGKQLNQSEEEVSNMLRRNYDGYHFSRRSKDIYNPFSLVSAFAKNDIGSYWSDSGTPTYLVTLIQKMNLPFKNISPIEVDRVYLETAGLLASDPIPAFYQSGYLTISSYDSDTDSYILTYPNEEVKEGFLKFLLRSYIPEMRPGSGFTIPDFIRAVRNGDAEVFMQSMDSLLAGVPYSEKGSAESHFQNAIYLLFTLLGFFAHIEQRTSDGRIDLTVETHDKVYIFEFKIDSSAQTAINQIKEKKYWLPYLTSNKEIFLIGADFSTKTRHLSNWIIEHIK